MYRNLPGDYCESVIPDPFELGSQAFQRRWYLVIRLGRVGHCQLSMNNYIVVTGGAGFVGTNLIEYYLKKTKLKIISIDNYSSGLKRNHINSNRIIYIKGSTINIEKLLKKYKSKINSLFHFGEFSRIFQSFKNFSQCYDSNILGSKEVFRFCLNNNIKLIYSATSATLGKNGNDKNLSPYAFC